MPETSPGVVPPTADRILLSMNPRAGRRNVAAEIERLTELLGKEGFLTEVFTDLDAVAHRAQEWHSAGWLRGLVSVGGDGTAAELVNRISSDVPLLIYPAGTSNLLATQLGLSTDADFVVNTLKAGHLTCMDAARASGRLFLLMLSCGFDAEVVHKVHTLRQSSPEGHITYWSYLKPILDSIRSYDYPEIRIHCEGPEGNRQELIRTRWAFASNLPPYGWGVSLAPRADGHDGLLDLVTFEHGSLWHGLLYAAAIQVGQHEQLPDCRCQRVRRLRIESDRPVAYQLDGDPGGLLPVEVEVLPGRVTFLVPPQ